MTKRTQREGSAERAADRGKGELLGLPSTAKPNLGDPGLVESLMRSFLTRVVEIRSAYNKDEMEGPEAAQAVSDASQQYASIFMGGDAEYEGSRWNGPDALGAYLVLLGYDPDPQRSCFALFVTTANEVIEAMSMHEDDMIDDDTAQLVVDAAVEDGVQALLGVPPQQDD